ncbi:MAG: hypothetical protein PHV51_04995, partial [Methanosarcinaceae archaeon]|nr:hypothetical protein [Methanosarcinaceae archaeon]
YPGKKPFSVFKLAIQSRRLYPKASTKGHGLVPLLVENRIVSTLKTKRGKGSQLIKNTSKYYRGQMVMNIRQRSAAFLPALKQPGFLPEFLWGAFLFKG